MKLEDKRREEKTDLLQLVGFKIDSEEFAINILIVQEIIKLLKITKVPNAPNFVEGVVNLRGRIIPVINLRTRLGMDEKKYDAETRIIVVDLSDKTIGFIVDEVKEVLRIPKSITEPPPEIVSGVDSEYITAIGKLEDRLLILLDLTKILSNSEHEQIA